MNSVADIGAMLQLVRVARGFTQDALSNATGISQAVLSKAESGIVALDDARLALVAEVLEVPIDRFLDGAPAGGVLSACAFHRKRASLPVSDAKRIRAILDLTGLEVAAVLSDVEPHVSVPRETPSDDGWTTPADIAYDIREAAGLGNDPIPDLVGVVESLGAVILVRDLQATKIDAIGSWPEGYRPLFLLNASSPADRRRFTLAHEFGHAVMHSEPRTDQEREADQFASELLLPAAGVRDDLVNLDLGKLALLKRKWGASMAALVRKARDVGTITENEYKKLNIELSTAGYRLKEPVDLPLEQPSLMMQRLRSRLENGATVEDLARLTHMLPNKFHTAYLQEAS
ncbi:helix-turn-helix domain-containing protein [Nocardioides bruguierae]|uniref:XRE family transcriptional regulator n=1 Tax=Nocardioides bruguierae TaxID=2945102 RepID=A0A9X2DCP1_9ACTN|nr:XRE family transcriptional regulator [Nocardioides bruguierae]MCM0622049.1 XRE family transcriptional regulator [Nocardioides bruguierae]